MRVFAGCFGPIKLSFFLEYETFSGWRAISRSTNRPMRRPSRKGSINSAEYGVGRIRYSSLTPQMA